MKITLKFDFNYLLICLCIGVFLPKLCEAQAGNVRREMAELRSSGFVVAPGPLHPAKLEVAPAVSPAFPPF